MACSPQQPLNGQRVQRISGYKFKFVDLKKAFDRVSRKVMPWALRKKGLPEILVKVMISLYEGSMTKVKVGSEFSKKFHVAVGIHQGSVFISVFV